MLILKHLQFTFYPQKKSLVFFFKLNIHVVKTLAVKLIKRHVLNHISSTTRRRKKKELTQFVNITQKKDNKESLCKMFLVSSFMGTK